MNLNRFALVINPYGIEKDFIKGRPLSMIEEILFYLLPKKVNIGGYGFFTLNIHTEGLGENKILHGGQIIEFDYRKKLLNPIEFANMTIQQQFNCFLDIIEEVIQEVNLIFETDKEKFDIAIAVCRDKWPIRFEEKLKISKTHSGRKLKVDFVRVLEYTGESILYRLLDKDNTILKEQLLKDDSSIYDARYDYKNSKWEGDKILVFDRFNNQILEIDTLNYLNK